MLSGRSSQFVFQHPGNDPCSPACRSLSMRPIEPDKSESLARCSTNELMFVLPTPVAGLCLYHHCKWRNGKHGRDVSPDVPCFLRTPMLAAVVVAVVAVILVVLVDVVVFVFVFVAEAVAGVDVVDVVDVVVVVVVVVVVGCGDCGADAGR